jgi:hypothetical protein
MNEPKITVRLSMQEAYAIVREAQTPRITSYADMALAISGMALAISGRKKIARAMRRVS